MINQKQILVVNLAGMGDIILASPAIKALKEKFRESSIFLLTFRDNVELVTACPYLEGVFLFDKRLSLGNFKVLFDLRCKNFDAALNLYNIHSFGGAVKMFCLFLMIAAKETFGRDTQGRGFFFRHRLKEFYPLKKHDAQTMLDLAGLLGAKGSLEDQELWLDETKNNLHAFFDKHHIKEADCLICIHPGATRASHRWPVGYFVELADGLASRYNAKIIITGTAKEKGLALKMAKAMRVEAVIAAGEWTLTDFAACLKKAKLFVTNDTGPMHLAGVLGAPLVVIAGCSPTAFLPYRKNNTVVVRNELKGKNAGSCLKAITSPEVLTAAEVFLKAYKNPLSKAGPATKVLHLHTRAIIGGSGTNVLLTLAGLPKEKFTGHLACGFQEAQDLFFDQVKAAGLEAHNIPHLINRINIVDDFLALIEIIRLIKKERYTIVHTHNSKAGILGRLAAKICGVPVIIHTIHSCPFNYAGVSPFTRGFFLLLEKMAALLTDRFIAISEHLKEEFVHRGIAPAEKIEIVYSGIELEKFKSSGNSAAKKEQLGFGKNDILVGVVARLEKGKGHEGLIDSVPALLRKRGDISFLLVGDGPMRSQLENKVKDTHLEDCFTFTGLRSDVPEILQAIDIFCLPSLYEGMGRVLLEAQASGRPVVANRAGGIPNVVCDKETALLVEPRDHASMAAAILTLAQSPALREDMGRKGEKFVSERFSAGKMVENIIKIYDGSLMPAENTSGKKYG